MARGLGDGLLRLCNGKWRDNDGDAVDIVEVVRCKDCKHWEKETGDCTEHPTYYDFGMDWYIYDEDDFCSCGERRTDG